MNRLVRYYDGLVVALACVAGAIPLFVLTAVVLGVATRTAGIQPPVWTQAYAELSLLFCTMFAAPWLVRTRGHVFIASFVSMLPARPRRLVEKMVYVLCISVSLIILYYSLGKFFTHLTSGEYEARSVDIPLWVVFSALPPGFLLIAIEFARYLFGKESMYSESDKVPDGI